MIKRNIILVMLCIGLILPIISQIGNKVEGFSSKPQRGVGVKKNATTTEKRVALVVGNGSYEQGRLPNAVNDAKDIAVALRRVGFDVLELNNANKRQMESTIREFGEKIKGGAVGLFYFAGHGIQIRDHNYLVPIQCQIEKEADVEYESVDVGRVLAEMETAQNQLNIIILDACRNNPFARSFRTSAQGLAQMTAPSGTLISYATAPGSVASDNPNGRNGLYTQELLKLLEKPGLELAKLQREVRASVEEKSSKKQVPWESSSVKGDFYFVNPSTENNNSSNNDANTSPATSTGEQKYWESIDQKSVNQLRAYLKKYPDGEYADLASAKIKDLEPVSTSNNTRPSTNNSNVTTNPGISAPAKPTNTVSKPQEREIKNSIGMELVLIEAGNFEMGSNTLDSEKPEHTVVIKDPFYMGKYEVTQAEWQAVMGNNPSGFKGDGRLPVEQVSWDDAVEFCKRLSQKEGREYRLPSEAEWEYGCRAGSREDYAGNLDAMAWYDSNSGNKTHVVGGKQANVWGLYDMHGNVWEWCQDSWHENYEGAPRDGSVWNTGANNSRRVLRGGSWYLNALFCRSSYRNWLAPDIRDFINGFRVVASARTLP